MYHLGADEPALQRETVVSTGLTIHPPWVARTWLIVRSPLDAVDHGRQRSSLSIDWAAPPLIDGSTTQVLTPHNCAEGILYSYLYHSGGIQSPRDRRFHIHDRCWPVHPYCWCSFSDRNPTSAVAPTLFFCSEEGSHVDTVRLFWPHRDMAGV